jgi:Domain of unknown function (DUF4345)
LTTLGRQAAWFFFSTYVGVLIVAGIWGAGFAPLDMSKLLGVDLGLLPRESARNLLSQYRFLRAIELAFGVFAVQFRGQIFNTKAYCALFLFGMSAGISGRLLGLAIDGRPSPIMIFFALYEILGLIVIGTYSRRPGGPLAAGDTLPRHVESEERTR